MKETIKRLIESVLILTACAVVGCSQETDAESQPEKVRTNRMIKSVKPKLSEKRQSKSVGRKSQKKLRKEWKKKWKKLPKEKRKELMDRMQKSRAEVSRKALSTPDPDWSKADQSIFKDIRRGLENEDKDLVRRAAAAAMKSSESEVRAEAVAALSWLGPSGMSGLTGYLGDADEDVASAAQMAWEQALMEIEDEPIKLQYVETAMKSLDDPDIVDSISMNLHGMEDEAAAVQAIMRIVASGNQVGVEKAKEAYEFITGEDWTNPTAAAQWIASRQAEAQEE